MLKESILLVASTGVLIYLIAPSNKPAQTDPAPVVAPKLVPPAQQSPDDAWGDDESDSEDQSFVFGEPLVNLNDGNNKTFSDDEASQSADFSANRAKSSGKGSLGDPLEFTPRAGPHPSDH